jgi:hypothetical protein
MKRRQEQERTLRNQIQRDQIRRTGIQAKHDLQSMKTEQARKNTHQRKNDRHVSD